MYTPLRRRMLKWSTKLFCYLYTLTIIQSFILHKKLLISKGQKPIKLTEFVINLGNALTKEYLAKRRAAAVPRSGLQAGGQHLLRLSARHFSSLLPPTTNNPKPRRRCLVCVETDKAKNPNQRKTHWGTMTSSWCRHCEIPLCPNACFEKYHTVEKYWL